MNDLTILYYTANRIPERFQSAVMCRLAETIGDQFEVVIVSQTRAPKVTHHSIGNNSTCRPVWAEPSIWQVYQNILTGAKAASTPYVACCEDDTLYSRGHFMYRPPLDTFGYNHFRFVITRKRSDDGKRREAFYYFRTRTQMAMCIAPRELLIETLEERFAKYPTPVEHETAKKTGWGEPGRYERNLGLTERKLEYFRSAEANVTFNHGDSLMGRRKVNDDDILATTIEPWGEANALWKAVYGE